MRIWIIKIAKKTQTTGEENAEQSVRYKNQLWYVGSL